jgi:hypothetical protein
VSDTGSPLEPGDELEGARRSRLVRPPATRPLPGTRAPWWLVFGALAVALALIALTITAAVLMQSPAPTPAVLELQPANELDNQWGSYLSERDWGTPREAVGTNSSGVDWQAAITTDYRYGSDGIGGMSDASGEFNLGWAFWDGQQAHVTERFNGFTDTQGPAGAAITDDRVFHENEPTHAYQHLTYRYPQGSDWFTIDLESARYDDTSMTMVATVTNTTSQPRNLDVVFKAWLGPGGEVDSLTDGLLLRGSSSVVAVVGQKPSQWQISSDKGALDANLRTGGLVGDQGGNIGALAYRLEIPGNTESVIAIGIAQVPLSQAVDAQHAADQASGAARAVLAQSSQIVDARRTEADTMFTGQVSQHQDLYRQALMSLLWDQSYYRWDGASGVTPDWADKVDAANVLLEPDKWKYPWLASWDSAFEAVTASLIDPQIAEDQLSFVLSDQWEQPDGHIPCGETAMDQECPPIFAWAAWRIYEVNHDQAWLGQVYQGLARNYDYWWTHEQVGDALFTGGSMGMDNLPRSDAGQPRVDATAWMAFFARDMARIASELGDTAASERYWVDRGHIQEQINSKMWDDSTGFYYDLTPDGGFVADKSYAGLIPLIAGVVPDERLPSILSALRDESQFMSPGGIRSMSAASPDYLPATAGPGVDANWRGPVWVPINYLLVETLSDVDPSLAAEIRDRVVSNVEQDWQQTGRLHEYFNGNTGQGLGADNEAWTALVANLIEEAWPASATH